MAIFPYTLEQSEEDIATLRGQVDALTEYLATGQLNVGANLAGNHFGVDSNGNVYLNTAGAIGALIEPTSSAPQILYGAGGQGAGISGYLSGGLAADFTHFTVTSNTGFVQASNAWSIPANDAQVGTTYRLTVAGNGTQGATSRQIEFETSGGFARVIASLGAASASITWKVVVEITVITTGSGGTCNVSLQLSGADVTNNTITAGSGFTQAAAFNTTTGFTFELVGQWGNTGCTFTSYQSYLERIGP